MTNRRRILLDTDLAMGAPGSDIDDGFALALAVADPGLDLDLVTTVHGNTDVDTATDLAEKLLARLGRTDVPVVRGAGSAVGSTMGSTARPTRESGPLMSLPRRRSRAATELVERVMAAPGEVTIVAVGPLTNVAIALLVEPGLADAVAEIVVMGGVFRGQTNVAAMPGEFNMWADPDAAAGVLRSGAPIRMVGLDVTRQVRLTRADATRLRERKGSFGSFAGECALSWIDYHARRHPGDPLEQDSCAMHDPLAVSVLTCPDLVSWHDAYVAVETVGTVARGVTVADLLTGGEPPAPNCRIALDVRADEFTELFLQRLASL